MSEENVENIRQAVEAFNRRDADAFVALASPNIEWEDPSFWSGVARTYRGREEVREWFNQIVEPWESIHVEIEEVSEAADDRVFVGLFLTARGKGSGVEAPGLRVWQVNQFEHGKTARRQVFLERAEALEAAGLRE
jgi:ketosteroid isomerase-like protein